MKKALLQYWHGLGDVIQLTPHLRYLFNEGYIVDLMCREQVVSSHLLDECPYVDKLIVIPNPWQSKLGFVQQKAVNIKHFNELRPNYAWSGISNHENIGSNFKIDFTSKELGLVVEDRCLEVFIKPEVEDKALDFIRNNYSTGYIFTHTYVEAHNHHSWDASEWIRENLPQLPVLKSEYTYDINYTFVLARQASHRVLSSSVMVHACDAMGCIIDVINYGRADRKVWPLEQERVLHIREGGNWIK